jgi:RNA polymerase sigma factor (sigma-70 family)
VDDLRVAERIERIYGERYAFFCRLATAVTGSVEAAHDAVQDGFARALAHCDDFRGEGSLEGWLWRIVLRRALDARQRSTPAPLPNDDVGATALWWAPELPHPERDPELDLALRSLPQRQRLIVFLRYFADLSHAEIAEVSGIAPGTVSATLNQARATLARRLDATKPKSKEIHQ